MISVRETTTLADFKYYHYNPSVVAAAIFVALFGITALCHAFQLFKRRTWYFIPFLIGVVFEAVGYAARAVSSTQTPNWTLMPYIIQSLFILIAPAFFAASIYMVLSRIIHLLDAESHSIIPRRFLTKLFVLGDVLSFLAQSSGGGMLASAKTQSKVDLGQNIITGGLGLQVLFFGLFIAVAGIFHYRIVQFPTSRSKTTGIPWQKHLMVLYSASLLILIRSTFRIIEYVMGQGGILLGHEIYLYIFDTTLMFLVTVVLCIWHPGALINSKAALVKGDIESHGLHERGVGREEVGNGDKY